MSEKYDFKILIEQLTRRLDSHGQDIREMKDKLDTKIDIVISKLDACKEWDCKAHFDFANRLTVIESEKGIFGKFLAAALGFGSGIAGGFFGKNL